MKSNEIVNKIEKSDDIEEKEAVIKASAQAFDILSSKIYTDVPLAIVRELSTNAYDAHVEAGNASQPFCVHLPTSQESFFSIRDFGTGLDDKKIKTVFTDYFDSTRNKSNDFVGCFGLGSKTPFAYTDKFVVTSFYNGEANHYCLYKNERGIPTISLLQKGKTTEPNGLFIKIDIKQSDHYNFLTAATRVYEFFAVRPTLNINLVFPKRQPAFIDGKNSIANNQGPISVILGQIPYYFDSSKVSLRTTRSIIIHAEIGSCSVSASREELHYDQKTIAFVQGKLNDLADAVKQKYKKELALTTNELDAFILYQNYKLLNVEIQHVKIDLSKARNIEYNYNKRLRLENLDFNWSSVKTRPFIIDQDVDIETKHRRNLTHFVLNSQKDFWIVKYDKDDLRIFGRPDIKLSEIPSAPKNIVEQTIIRQYVKLVDDYGLLCQVNEIDEHTACFVKKRNNLLYLNEREVGSTEIKKIAQIFGYHTVYAISSSRVNTFKGNLANLEAECKIYIQNWFNNASKYERSRINYHNSRFCLPLPLGLSATCDDIINYNKVTINGEDSIRSLIHIFDIDNSKAVNYSDAFFERYPLISHNPNTALINDVILYIKEKEKCLTSSQKRA